MTITTEILLILGILAFCRGSIKRDILILGVILAGCNSAHAAEDKWFCTDDQAMRQGSTLSICGVGTSSTEGDARQNALKNVMYEFNVTCQLSSDCRGHKINVEPKRSTCFENDKRYHSLFENYTCHRLFVFTIL